VNIPELCPICGDKIITLAEAIPTAFGVIDVLVCRTYPKINANNHFYIHLLNNDQADRISFLVDDELVEFCYVFGFQSKSYINVENAGNHKDIVLPFFEPDFSDMYVLMQKLKTYTTFS
jgi:hypothetical protein